MQSVLFSIGFHNQVLHDYAYAYSLDSVAARNLMSSFPQCWGTGQSSSLMILIR